LACAALPFRALTLRALLLRLGFFLRGPNWVPQGGPNEPSRVEVWEVPKDWGGKTPGNSQLAVWEVPFEPPFSWWRALPAASALCRNFAARKVPHSLPSSGGSQDCSRLPSASSPRVSAFALLFFETTKNCHTSRTAQHRSAQVPGCFCGFSRALLSLLVPL